MKRILYWRNIPGIEDTLDLNIHYENKIRVMKNITVPYFYYARSGPIFELDSITFDQATIDSINKTGLYFYMYEPLGLRCPDFNGQAYEGEFIDAVPYQSIRSNDLDSIKTFCERNKLDNVTVYVCDYNVQKIQTQYSGLKLKCLDTFLRSIDYDDEYNTIENKIQKKFWCGNWRYTPHRHIMTAYLIQKSGNYSWNLQCDFETIKNNYWFDFENLKTISRYDELRHGIEILKSNVFSIDQITNTVNVDNAQNYYVPGPNPGVSRELIESYKECFCAVVNESKYASPLSYISEKTLTAINVKLPFLLAAPPHGLEYLKKLGFKTFDRWWDESYDKEENHQTRMLMLFDIIDYIDSKSLEELSAIYEEMQETLLHNLEILKTVPYYSTVL